MKKLEQFLLNFALICQFINILRILNIYLKLNIEKLEIFIYINKNIIALNLLNDIIISAAFWSLFIYTIVWFKSFKK